MFTNNGLVITHVMCMMRSFHTLFNVGCYVFILMMRGPPRSTRTDTLFPYTTLFRSIVSNIGTSIYWPLPVRRRWISAPIRSEEHTSELQSLMRISYAVFCLKTTNAIIAMANAILDRITDSCPLQYNDFDTILTLIPLDNTLRTFSSITSTFTAQ